MTADLRAPHEVVRLIRRLEDAGHTAWAVGGAVRDALLGERPEDWDIATSARPREVMSLFRRTIPVGIDHGTVGVLGKDSRLYEVTTYRRDVETFGRRAVVAFADRLEDDLARRDFTINAVAWHPLTKEVRDPFGGLVDMEAKLLRTVGEPAERFAEDWLRVLRALRFAGRFDMQIEPATWAAVGPAVSHLTSLSAERVREELWKVLSGNQIPSTALALYRTSGALDVLYPELWESVSMPSGDGERDVWTHLLEVTDAVPRHRPLLRLAALLHDIGKPAALSEVDGRLTFPGHAERGAALARELMRRLKFSNQRTDTVVHLVAQHDSLPEPHADDSEFRRWLRRVGEDHMRDVLRLALAHCRAAGERGCEAVATARRARNVLRTRPALGIGDLAIDGGDLRSVGLPPGPLYGEILRDLLDRVTDQPELNERDTLLRLVRDRIE